MKIGNLTKAIRPALDKVSQKLSEKAPEILIGSGILFGIGSAITAWQAGREHDDILKEVKSDFDAVHQKRNEAIAAATTDADHTTEDFYPTVMYRKDLFDTTVSGVKKLAVVYWKPILLGGISVACIGKGTGLMRSALADAQIQYASIASLLNTYRNNVIDKYGPEVDHQMLLGGKVKNVKNEIQNEDGTTTEETARIRYLDAEPEVLHTHDFKLDKQTCEFGWNENYKWDENKMFMTRLEEVNSDMKGQWKRDGVGGDVCPGIMSLYDLKTRWLGYNYKDIFKKYGAKACNRKMNEDKHWGWIYDSENPKFANTVIEVFKEPQVINGVKHQIPRDQEMFLNGIRVDHLLLTPRGLVDLDKELEANNYI